MQKLFGVAIHPDHGGWFAIRGIFILKNLVPDNENVLTKPPRPFRNIVIYVPIKIDNWGTKCFFSQRSSLFYYLGWISNHLPFGRVCNELENPRLAGCSSTKECYKILPVLHWLSRNGTPETVHWQRIVSLHMWWISTFWLECLFFVIFRWDYIKSLPIFQEGFPD